MAAKSKTAQSDKMAWNINLPLFYEDPVEEVDITELEKMTKRRVEMLKSIEFSMQERIVMDRYVSGDPLFSLKGTDAERELQDRASFFILKLAYCSHSEEAKLWVNTETALFKLRLKFCHPTKVLQQANIKFDQVDVASIDFPIEEDKGFIGIGYRYKVPLSLSACLLKIGYFPIRGFCYVTEEHLKDVVADLFRSGVELALREAQKNIITDERLKAIISGITNPDADNLYENKNPKERFVNLENLDLMAHNHFPPCMKRLFSNIKTNHHLKHFGRLQFGLFLKGVGLPLEDSLRFWRSEFCHKMTVEKFSKEYEYNIKHAYGKAGKMTDYTPWSCRKIVNFPNPADGELHGCPFRHAPRGEVLRILSTYGLNDEAKGVVMQRYPNEPERACIGLFKATHDNAAPDILEHVGRHPNSFFDASIKYHNQVGK